jgi:hypothetical protein
LNLDNHRDRENALALARLEGAIYDDDVETGGDLFEDGIADSLPYLLSGEDYQMFLDCQEAMKNDKGKSPLDAPHPAHILDLFSSLLGDGWHLMDRPKVPIHHCAKTSFMVALQEALYAWDPEMTRTVESALRNVGMTTKEIQEEKIL